MGTLVSIWLFLLAAGGQDILPLPAQWAASEGVFHYRGEEDVRVRKPDRRMKRDLSFLPDEVLKEAFRIEVGRRGVTIRAFTPVGEMYARNALAQMLELSDRLQRGMITDWPRYPYRGLMLDVSRHFFD